MTRRSPKVGRWYFRIQVSRDYLYHDPFVRVLEVTLVKLRREVPEAVEPRAGADYAGFRFRFVYRLPFYVRSWR